MMMQVMDLAAFLTKKVDEMSTRAPEFLEAAAEVPDLYSAYGIYSCFLTYLLAYLVFYTPTFLTYWIVRDSWEALTGKNDEKKDKLDSEPRRYNSPRFGGPVGQALVVALFAFLFKYPSAPHVFRSLLMDEFVGYWWKLGQQRWDLEGFLMGGLWISHSLFVLTVCIPCAIVPLVPSLAKTKLQPKKDSAGWYDLMLVGGGVFVGHCVLVLPGLKPAAMAFEYVGSGYHWETLHSMETAFPHLIAAMVVDDCWHYWFHHLIHVVPILYKKVHKYHHLYSAPFGLEAEFAHPAETMILGFGFIMGVCCLPNHLGHLMAWMMIRVTTTTDVHMGYKCQTFPSKHLIPFFADASHHDFHHARFIGNYAPCFEWWDRWVGTDAPYEKFLRGKLAADAVERTTEAEKEKYGKKSDKKESETSSKDKGGDAPADEYAERKSQSEYLLPALVEDSSDKKKSTSQYEYSKSVAGKNWDYSGKKIAITGGAGMVGKAMIPLAVDRGAEKVVVIDRAEQKVFEKELEEWVKSDALSKSCGDVGKVRENLKSKVQYVQMDLAEDGALRQLEKALKGIDVVLHLVALVGPFFPKPAYTKVNIEGAQLVADACKSAGVKALVDMTSPTTRLDGYDCEGLDEATMDELEKRNAKHDRSFCLHEYGRTKLVGERIILNSNSDTLKTCSVGPHQVYGELDQLFLPNILRAVLKNRLRRFGEREVSISFTYMANVAHGALCLGKALLNGDCAGEFFLVTDGAASPFWHTIDEAGELLASEHNRKYSPLAYKLHVPLKLIYTVGFIAEVFSKFPKLSRFSVNMLTIHRYFDISKIKHEAGYVPLVAPAEAWKNSVRVVGAQLIEKEKV